MASIINHKELVNGNFVISGLRPGNERTIGESQEQPRVWVKELKIGGDSVPALTEVAEGSAIQLSDKAAAVILDISRSHGLGALRFNVNLLLVTEDLDGLLKMFNYSDGGEVEIEFGGTNKLQESKIDKWDSAVNLDGVKFTFAGMPARYDITETTDAGQNPKGGQYVYLNLWDVQLTSTKEWDVILAESGKKTSTHFFSE